jgi:hypothetical protein
MRTFASTTARSTWRSQIATAVPMQRRWVVRFALAVALSLPIFNASHAAEYGRSVIISGTLTIAGTRPAHPLTKDFMLVYINDSSAPWGSCRHDAVVIKKDDTHLLAQFLAARATGEPIAFYVDDTLKPFGDDTCQVTLIQVGVLPSA